VLQLSSYKDPPGAKDGKAREEIAMDHRPSLAERWESYRPTKALWFWSCVACVVATLVVGFGWAGWVTGGAASKMTADAEKNARAQLAAAVCVNRFDQAADAGAQRAAFLKTDTWQRDDFIKKGGWATPPGAKEPVSGAADLCAQQLVAEKTAATTTTATTK
jgi:hypothetical protein